MCFLMFLFAWLLNSSRRILNQVQRVSENSKNPRESQRISKEQIKINRDTAVKQTNSYAFIDRVDLKF